MMRRTGGFERISDVRLSESNTRQKTPRSLPFALGAGAPHVVRASRLAKSLRAQDETLGGAFGKHFVEKIVEQGATVLTP